MKVFGKFLLVLFAAAFFAVSGQAFAAETAEPDRLLGVREGWAWPVVVVQPPGGWESAEGAAVKLAMRTAEREISIEREAIRGKEVTFMFSDISDPADIRERVKTWRAMKVAAIVTFADKTFNDALAAECLASGPSVIIDGGEDAELLSPETGTPYNYLFALDLPYYARANALAEAAMAQDPSAEAAVVTDILSRKLARGAEINSEILKAKGMNAYDISLTAYRQDQFGPQVREAEAGGTRLFSCWLDAMATLSIWQSSSRRRNGSVILYCGAAQKILLDAEGLIMIDPDAPLTRNEDGKNDIIRKIRDAFNAVADDPVKAARAYALAKWVIAAYRRDGSGEAPSIAYQLERAGEIPLMDETLSIDPRTHRPKSRRYGVLKISDREYKSYGFVEVFSSEAFEK